MTLHRRQFALGAAYAAAMAPFFGLAGCGGSDDPVPVPVPGPTPIPSSAVQIRLPADHYLHRGAPTEWWWHIGTLKAGTRTFGFEINTASFAKDGFAFSQIMLSDIANNKNYQRTTPYIPPFMFDADNWAQSDVTKDWSVKLGDPANKLSALELTNPGSGYTSAPTVQISGGGGVLASGIAVLDGATGKVANVVLFGAGVGYTSLPTVTLVGGGGTGATAKALFTYVTMDAPWADPSKNMKVKAALVDEATGTLVDFDLKLSQNGPPLIVWGTGVNGGGSFDTNAATHLQKNNYYYSLTRLQTSGTVTIGGEKLDVSGVTWMDHEYGAFGTAINPVKWVLQAMQLDNGVCLSNYATYTSGAPVLNKKAPSQVTVQRADGTTYLVDSFLTPIGRTWTSPVSKTTFNMQFLIEIPSFNASLTVTSLMDSQEFPVPTRPTYEGVASVTGTFEGKTVSGTAWNEQSV
ncbi:MAG: secreted hydrolase-like protein [Polaromonas sp.]|nr:secreted hydrolase-like protein [Polaromonas sp.]